MLFPLEDQSNFTRRHQDESDLIRVGLIRRICFDVCLCTKNLTSPACRRSLATLPYATLGLFNLLIDAVCFDGLKLSVEKPSAFILD